MWPWLLIFGLIASFLVFVFQFAFRILEKRGGNQRAMISLNTALLHFKAEYGTFPLQSDLDVSTRTEGTLLLALLAKDESTNARKIIFADWPAAVEGAPGLTLDSRKLVDSWGQAYYLILDTNNDNQLDNPEAVSPMESISDRVPANLTAPSAIYSSGPDRDPRTWGDNITSWR